MKKIILDHIDSFCKTKIFQMFSIGDVAEFYLTSNETVKTIMNRNRTDYELHEELVVLRGSSLKKYKEELCDLDRERTKGINSLTLITKEGLIRTGLLMLQNKKSEDIREEIISNGDIPLRYKSLLIGRNHQPLAKQYGVSIFLEKSLGNLFKIDKQIKIGKYRIDFLIDKYVIVECDEFGHKQYNQLNEMKRNNYLINNGYHIIRFNPDTTDCPYELINKILTTIHKCKEAI